MQAIPQEEPAILSFGVIADTQYGDVEPHGGLHPRVAIERLADCVRDFNSKELAFAIQLGDIIEGQPNLQKTHEDLDRILHVFNRLQMQKYHSLGNHDVAHADREVMQRETGLVQPYYAFTHPLANGWRFIVLDGNEGEQGVEGFLGKIQLAWLEGQLAEAAKGEQKVIVFSHYALLKAAAPHDLMHTPEPVLKLIEGSGRVAGYFAGHDHGGGYANHNGIHHLTFTGMVEAPQQNAYAVVELFSNYFKVVGFGKEPSRTCVIPN